ncbi:MAG: hydrogenase small subunit [Anaerolineales bacterium]|nr:hydrogenase small subunit [Anaerolineales bacterium]
MLISRRDFLKYCGATAGALGLTASGFARLQEVLALEGGQPVVWLQGQNCTGCSVSLLNTIHYMTIDELLLNTIDLEFHSTVMAAAGDLAVSAAEAALSTGGYVLVVEGAIPTAEEGRYCYLWPGMTALDGVRAFSENAAAILAVGTCAAYGGIPAGDPNPTGAMGVSDILDGKPVVNLPGCPAHPDWIVGTIAHLLAYGEVLPLDSKGRPKAYYQRTVHSDCPNQKHHAQNFFAGELSEAGCLSKLGCQGQWTGADCPVRKWNSGGAGEYGVNWCIEARNPCQGCTEPDFPDGKSPLYTLEHPGKAS